MGKYHSNIKYQRQHKPPEREEKVLWTIETRLRHDEKHEYIKEGDKLIPREIAGEVRSEGLN